MHNSGRNTKSGNLKSFVHFQVLATLTYLSGTRIHALYCCIPFRLRVRAHH